METRWLASEIFWPLPFRKLIFAFSFMHSIIILLTGSQKLSSRTTLVPYQKPIPKLQTLIFFHNFPQKSWQSPSNQLSTCSGVFTNALSSKSIKKRILYISICISEKEFNVDVTGPNTQRNANSGFGTKRRLDCLWVSLESPGKIRGWKSNIRRSKATFGKNQRYGKTF